MTLTSNIEQRNPQVLLSEINCCSYKNHGFHKIFAFSRKNAKFCEMLQKNFVFFHETFRSLKTLLGSEKKSQIIP